jgi:enamidase
MPELEVTTIVNAGRMLTGDLNAPVADGDAVRIADGRITAIGGSEIVEGTVIDAGGMTVAPGLIDSHSHVLFGDYTPRQQSVGFLERYVHGAMTQVVSAGEIHIPNRPRDPASVKGLARLAAGSWRDHRPGGMKVNAGVILLTPGLTAEDMRELAEDGIRLAKYGFSNYPDIATARDDVRNAQRNGIVVTAHSGGPTAADGVPVGADLLMELAPDIAGHVNGGPTSLDDDGVRTLVTQTQIKLQLVQAGSLRSALLILDTVREAGAEHRVILGTDTPTGTGVMPLGLLKTVAELTSLGGVEPATTWAWGSGCVADAFGLAGGRLAVGQPADLVVVDAPLGSVAPDAERALARGDIPAVALVMTDGVVRVNPSALSPRPRAAVTIRPAA